MRVTLRELVESLSKPMEEATAWALLEESSRALSLRIQNQGENIRPFITPDYVLLIQGRGLQFVFGDQEELAEGFAAPELVKEGTGFSFSSADVQKGYVFSLGALVSFALEFGGGSEIGSELEELLRQMMSSNPKNRPDVKLVLETSQQWIRAHLPGSCASGELDKLMQPSLPYGLVDSEDSGSLPGAEPLSEEIAAAERSTVSEGQLLEGSHSGQSSPSLGSKEPESLTESLGDLSHPESLHSAADIAIEEITLVVQRVEPKEGKPVMTATSLSSHDSQRHQSKNADIQVTTAKTELPCHQILVKERERSIPEEASVVPHQSTSSEEVIRHKELLNSSPERKVAAGASTISAVTSTTLQPKPFQEEQHDAPQAPPPPSTSPPEVDFIDDHKTMTHQHRVGTTNWIDLDGVEENLFSAPKSPSEKEVHNGTFDYAGFAEFTAVAKEPESSKDEFSFSSGLPLLSSSSSAHGPNTRARLPPPSPSHPQSFAPSPGIPMTPEEDVRHAVQEAFLILDREATPQDIGLHEERKEDLSKLVHMEKQTLIQKEVKQLKQQVSSLLVHLNEGQVSSDDVAMEANIKRPEEDHLSAEDSDPDLCEESDPLAHSHSTTANAKVGPSFPKDDNFHIITVTLEKGPMNAFGFTLRKSLPARREDEGLFILSVNKDPALADGRLKPGDEVIKVNGQSFLGVKHGKCVRIIRSVADQGTFLVRRRNIEHKEEIMENGQEGHTLCEERDKQALPQGNIHVSLVHKGASSDNQFSHDSEPMAYDQVPEEKVESLHYKDEVEGREEETLPELVHDENGYTVPETVVKRLRREGQDPTKWNQRTPAVLPPSEETALPMSTRRQGPENREELDHQISPENSNIDPYERVCFRADTPPMSNDTSAEEIELMNIDSPVSPVLPSSISDVEVEYNPAYRGESDVDFDVPHIEPSHSEQSSTSRDKTSSMKKHPIKLQSRGGPKTKALTERNERIEFMPPQQVPEGCRLVNVNILDGGPIELIVDPNILCSDLLEKVLTNQGIRDDSTLGLAVKEDDELVFLEPAKKLRNYAPKRWHNTPVPDPCIRDSPHQPPLFIVHLRVMFFMTNTPQLIHPSTRDLHYIQLKRDVASDHLHCSTTSALNLAALASQAEHGSHVTIQQYLPSRVTRELEGKNAIFPELQAKYKELSGEQAKIRFLQMAQQLDGYGKLYYRVSSAKKRGYPSDRLLAFDLNGVYIYNLKWKLILECPWKITDRILHDNRRITLDVAGKSVVFVYASSVKRARYFLKLAQLYHYFSRKIRNTVSTSSVKELMESRSMPVVTNKLGTPETGIITVDIERREIALSDDSRSGDEDPNFRGYEEATEAERSTRAKSRLASITTLERESTELHGGEAVMALSKLTSDYRTVTLRKQNGSFGLAIAGTEDNPYRGIRLSKMTPGGPADVSELLHIGDQIVSVNGKNVEQSGYKRVLQLIRSAPETVELVVCKAIVQEDTISVVLKKEKGVIGIQLGTNSDGKVFVGKISEGFPADRSGQVEVGDILLEVNGQNLDGLSQKTVAERLFQLRSPICLLLHRPTRQRKLEPVTEEPPDIDPSLLDEDNCYRFTATLVKNPKGTFGFKILHDPPEQREQKGLFVASVDEDPALSDGKLRYGDEILEVNGQNLVGMAYQKAAQIIRSIPSEGRFVIRRAAQGDSVFIQEEQED